MADWRGRLTENERAQVERLERMMQAGKEKVTEIRKRWDLIRRRAMMRVYNEVEPDRVGKRGRAKAKK